MSSTHLVLVIGDLHIPDRVPDLHPKFKKLLVPGKIQQIICTGNLCDPGTFEYLKTIAGDLIVAKGDYDDNPKFEDSKIITVKNTRIGVLHGHQIVPWGDEESLDITARQMEVDVLLTGHTHQFKYSERNGRLFINPGTATGAHSCLPDVPDPIPSFVLMDIKDEMIVTYVYKLIDDEVKVEKKEYKKGENVPF